VVVVARPELGQGPAPTDLCAAQARLTGFEVPIGQVVAIRQLHAAWRRGQRLISVAAADRTQIVPHAALDERRSSGSAGWIGWWAEGFRGFRGGAGSRAQIAQGGKGHQTEHGPATSAPARRRPARCRVCGSCGRLYRPSCPCVDGAGQLCYPAAIIPRLGTRPAVPLPWAA
jgi:hypothetical protein